MLTGVRPHADAAILVAAEAEACRRLQAQAPEIALVRVEPEAAAGLALAAGTRVFAWLASDVSAGLDAVLGVRKARPEVRLLYLTPRSAERERIAALEAGVDEVLAEPVSRAELAARLRRLLRRARPGRRSRLPIAGDLELDLERRELLRDGRWVHLRPKEARLLELFARSPGRVLSREHILERVWGPDHEGDPRTVDVHVRWLRAKVEPHPHQPVWLQTVRGVGYRLEPSPLTER